MLKLNLLKFILIMKYEIFNGSGPKKRSKRRKSLDILAYKLNDCDCRLNSFDMEMGKRKREKEHLLKIHDFVLSEYASLFC